MRCSYRHNMWCNCKKPVHPEPQVIPVDSIDGGFRQTDLTVGATTVFSFSYHPDDANSFTQPEFQTSDGSVAYVDYGQYLTDYHTYEVHIVAAGEGTAEITGLFNGNWFVTIVVNASSQPQFSPSNTVTIIPTRGNAILKFFASDGESDDYVGANLQNNSIVNISYNGLCNGDEYCQGLFSNEDVLSSLGASIGGYIDEYGIPDTGGMVFGGTVWSSIADYFNGISSIETVASTMEEQSSDIVEPTCYATIDSISPQQLSLVQGTDYFVYFYSTYDCSNPDYSRYSAYSSDDNVATIIGSSWSNFIQIYGAGVGECTITVSDGVYDYPITVTVDAPVAAELTNVNTETLNITAGEQGSISFEYAPNYATGFSSFNMYSDNDEIASVGQFWASDGYGTLPVDGYSVGNCHVVLEDGTHTYTVPVAVSSSDCTVYIQSDDTNKGTVDVSELVAPKYTEVIQNGNTITIGETTITATPVSGYEFLRRSGQRQIRNNPTTIKAFFGKQATSIGPLSANSVTVAEGGEDASITCTYLPADADAFDNISVTSSDSSIAEGAFSSLNGEGVITVFGISAGTTTITVSDGTNSYDIAVNVTGPIYADYITGISSNSIQVQEGGHTDITFTYTPTDANDLSRLYISNGSGVYAHLTEDFGGGTGTIRVEGINEGNTSFDFVGPQWQTNRFTISVEVLPK